MISSQKQRLALLLACAAVIALRGPLLVLIPRLVAEEASVYLAHAMSHGVLQSLLLVPTSEFPAGYLNLAANLAAVLAANLFPLEWAAAVAMVLALSIQLVPFALVLWGRSLFWNTPRRRLLCCLVLLFSPALHPAAWLSTANSQVFCGLIAFLILCEDLRGASLRRRFIYRGLLVFCGLTGPYAAMLLPAFLIKTRLTRSAPEPVRQLAIVAATAGLQLAAYCATLVSAGIAPDRFESSRPLANLAGILLYHVLQPLSSHHLVEPLGRLISVPAMHSGWGISEAGLGLAAAISLALLLVILVLLARRQPDPHYRLILWGLASVSAATAILALGLPRLRYSVLPGLLFTFVLLVSGWSSRPGTRRNICRALVSMSLLVGLATYWIDGSYLANGSRISVFGYGEGRPDWPREVAGWREDPRQVLRVWPYKAGESWQTFLPLENEFQALRAAFAEAGDFHLVAADVSSERRIAIDLLPADFKVVIAGKSHRAVPRARVEAVLEDARRQPLATLQIANLPSPGPFIWNFNSYRLAASTERDLGKSRFFVLRLLNEAPETTAVVSIEGLEMAPRVEGLLDAALPATLWPTKLFYATPGVVTLNAVLFGILAALAWRDRRGEGFAGQLFAIGIFLGSALLGFVFVPGFPILEGFCLFLALRLWLGGRLEGSSRGAPVLAGVLLALAAFQEAAWGLFLVLVIGDQAARRHLRTLVLLGSAAAGAALILAATEPAWSGSEMLPQSIARSTLDIDPATEPRQEEASPDLAVRAWRFYSAPNGLLAGYPFILVAVFLFARDPGDRRRLLLLVLLVILTHWIAWSESATGLDHPLGSPRFAVLAPLFALLPRRVTASTAPAVAALAWFLITFGLTSSAWTSSSLLPWASATAPARLAAAFLLAGALLPAWAVLRYSRGEVEFSEMRREDAR